MIYKRLYKIKGVHMQVFSVLSVVMALSCPTQTEVLYATAEAVEENYVDIDEGRRIAAAIFQWADSGRYAESCNDTAEFADLLNKDLDAYDGHFHFEAPTSKSSSEDWLMAWRADAASSNAGIREVRVLEGNVGYMRISTFYPWDLVEQKLTSAFKLLQGSRAMILDLRQNGGGDASTAEHLVRAVLEDEVEVVQKIRKRTSVEATPLPKRELPAYTKPMVVLVDRRTGSAAEFVAYSLQSLGRAKIVGSRTGGAASLIDEPITLPTGFRISIPVATPVNVVSGSSWERRGVVPDFPGGDDPLFVARLQLQAVSDH